MEDWGVPGETPEEGEWPARDRVPMVTMDEFHEKTGHRFAVPIGLRPTEVTPEMRAAGARLVCEGPLASFDAAEAIYRAMHAAAPVPLVSDAESALTRERDTLKVERECLQASLVAVTEAHDGSGQVLRETYEKRDEAIGKFEIVCEDKKRLLHQVAALRAELMAAHDRLAKFTTQNAAEPETPDPIANAILPREVNPRRMGLA